MCTYVAAYLIKRQETTCIGKGRKTQVEQKQGKRTERRKTTADRGNKSGTNKRQWNETSKRKSERTTAAGEDAREELERAGHVARIRCIRTRQAKRGL